MREKQTSLKKISTVPKKTTAMVNRSIRFEVDHLKKCKDLDIDVAEVCRRAIRESISIVDNYPSESNFYKKRKTNVKKIKS